MLHINSADKEVAYLPTINPHVYAEIEGEKVDVSLDPGHEEMYCKNSEKKLIIPVNISKLRRVLSRRSNLILPIKGKIEGNRYGN